MTAIPVCSSHAQTQTTSERSSLNPGGKENDMEHASSLGCLRSYMQKTGVFPVPLRDFNDNR